MCLGVPGQIKETYEKNNLKMAVIDFNGVEREACLAYIPEADIGDYVVVHVGFAISQLSEEEAQETLRMLEEIGAIEEELGVGGEGINP